MLNSSAELDSRGLYLKLSMKKSSYMGGEPVDVQLLVKNISEKDVVLNFDTNLEFDFTVQSELDLLFTQIPQNIWQYSSEPEHIPQPKAHSITISPGKEQVFRGTWGQQMFSGAQSQARGVILSRVILNPVTMPRHSSSGDRLRNKPAVDESFPRLYTPVRASERSAAW
jgi:hypothetical protein